MNDLQSALSRAAADGLISDEQANRLLPYLAGDGASSPQEAAGDDAAIVDTETPRFLRGFHDVLITVGVLILLSGVWGLGSVFAALPVIIVLAEIVVRRQRLALPAVALTLATVFWIGVVSLTVFDETAVESLEPAPKLFMLLLPFVPVLGLFYWRYRVPLSLAALFLSLAALALAAVFAAIGYLTGTPDVIGEYRLASSAIFLVSAMGLFVLAMAYDLSDPARVTRRSDIAFWLHLATAPALLYAMLSFIFMPYGGGLFPQLFGSAAYGTAAQIVCVVIVLMAIGIVIDRRAFVTSGLLSLIAAIVAVLGQGQGTGGGVVFLAMLVVGAVVLVIGIGWQRLRAAAIGLLPQDIAAGLPPVR